MYHHCARPRSPTCAPEGTHFRVASFLEMYETGASDFTRQYDPTASQMLPPAAIIFCEHARRQGAGQGAHGPGEYLSRGRSGAG